MQSTRVKRRATVQERPTDSQAEVDLVVDARRGDRAAQARLLDAWQDVIYRVCLTELRDVESARDATQETAVRILESLPRFAGRSRPRTWAIGIALNVCREHRRRHPVASLPDEPPMRLSPSPATAVIAREELELLHDALHELSDRQRQMIVLRYFEELSVEETAAATDAAPGTVKATVWQALRKLREIWNRVP